MDKVSTRTRPAATAVAKNATSVAKATTVVVSPSMAITGAPPPYWFEPSIAARNALSALLKAMRDHDDFEEDDRCCDALRIVSVASDLIDTMIGAPMPDMEGVQLRIANVGFDVKALLIAASAYPEPEQRFAKVRTALLCHAIRILDELTNMNCSGPDGLRFAPALQSAIEAAEDGRPGVKQRGSTPVGREIGDRTEAGADDKAPTKPLWVSAEAVLSRLDDMRTLLDIIGDECDFNFEDAAQSLRAQERISSLTKAAGLYMDAATATASALTDSLQATHDRPGVTA